MIASGHPAHINPRCKDRLTSDLTAISQENYLSHLQPKLQWITVFRFLQFKVKVASRFSTLFFISFMDILCRRSTMNKHIYRFMIQKKFQKLHYYSLTSLNISLKEENRIYHRSKYLQNCKIHV